LLTVETEAKGDSWSTYEMRVLPWLPSWPRAGTRDFCPALASLVGPVQNIIFLAAHYFTSFVPIAQKAGRHHYLFSTNVSAERRTITTMKKPLWSHHSGKFRSVLPIILVILLFFDGGSS
jgi:hypothetical protein